MSRTEDPIGLCSGARAEYLMGAAAAAGGAIYVALPPISGLTISDDGRRRYLCRGTLPSGDSVPTLLLERRWVIARLEAVCARWSRPDLAGALEEWTGEVRAVIADIRAAAAGDDADGGGPA